MYKRGILVADRLVIAIMNGTVDINRVLAVSGITAEAFCLGCFLLKRAFRYLPIVTCYLAFTVASELLGYAAYIQNKGETYWYTYLTIAFVGYALEVAVMLELVFSLAAPITSERLRSVKKATVCCLCGFAILSIAMTYSVSYRDVQTLVGAYLHVDLAFVVFRVLAFGAILGLTRILGIGWTSLGAQITACLSLYSVFALMAEIAHEYAARMPFQYDGFIMIEWLRAGTWCVVMLLLGWRVLVHTVHRSVHVTERWQGQGVGDLQ